MTWHLKDKELEEMLIERFPAFLYELDKAYKKAEYFNFSVRLCRKGFSFYTDDMTFNKDEIEEIPEYNPNDWNEFPEVMPPKCLNMRVEFKNSIEGIKAWWDGKCWRICKGTDFETDPIVTNEVSRFRPWKN